MLNINDNLVSTLLDMQSRIDAQGQAFLHLSSVRSIHRSLIDMYLPTGSTKKFVQMERY